MSRARPPRPAALPRVCGRRGPLSSGHGSGGGSWRCEPPPAQHTGAGQGTSLHPPPALDLGGAAVTTAPTLRGPLLGGRAPPPPSPGSPSTVANAALGGDGGSSADGPTPVPACTPSPSLALSATARCAHWGVQWGGEHLVGHGRAAGPMAQMWRAQQPRTQAALSAPSDPQP